ncbi:MAG: glycosyltransferase family 2 protein [Pseudomonadota bacterium]|nr:glycosyltransferase family 2 protein [Pseudomonadota bacterium]
MRTALLIPVLDEELALPVVLAELPSDHRVIVCDNGSTDRSVAIARELGAEVVCEPKRGYGGAVLAGIALLAADPPDVVVVLDGDHSIWVEDLAAILAPLREGRADLVIGERLTLGDRDSLTAPQRFGNRLATAIIHAQTGHRYRDMGPLRGIRWGALMDLDMGDPTWGWNVEMQLKALRSGVRVLEVPVRYRARIGTSKISGTVGGVARAGARILWACWKYR